MEVKEEETMDTIMRDQDQDLAAEEEPQTTYKSYKYVLFFVVQEHSLLKPVLLNEYRPSTLLANSRAQEEV